MVFAGGCVGGYARYAVAQAWSTPIYGFPWPTFTVNLVGSFVLGVVVVLATRRHESLRLRLLIGTGFCGALTTFGSVVVAVDELLARHHATTALIYLVATTVAALLVTAAAVSFTRSVAARW
jgi:CrcB protein